MFLTTLDLLDAALVSIGACKEARHNHVVAALEPTVATLLKKQGDGQARLRDGAMNGLVAVARCRTAGPVFVRCVLDSWLTVVVRLFLTGRISEFGCATQASTSRMHMFYQGKADTRSNSSTYIDIRVLLLSIARLFGILCAICLVVRHALRLSVMWRSSHW